MNFKQQIEVLINNLKALDARKKIGLGLGLLVLFFGIMAISIFVNKPPTTALYSNLQRNDINSMSRVLSENGFEFTISGDASSIGVAPHLVSEARLVLAEYGLPDNADSGYELFDNVNSLGLTSFMQGVTNKRAIQGELSRTIQTMSGITSARVHLVMPSKKLFGRKEEDKPSASLVLKTSSTPTDNLIKAIRHMVAAAVPGLGTDRVTIVSANGTLMTKGGGELISGFSRLSELERNFEKEAERKLFSALGAHIGMSNLRVAITVKLNNDQRQISETIFDPDTKIERSIQVVREKGNIENKSNGKTASITQNLPEEPDGGSSQGQSSQENSDKREETTNYEISKKQISTVTDGYQVEKLSVSLIVNKARISSILGSNASQQNMDDKLKELEGIVKSSLALSDERGDFVKVSIIEFLPEAVELENSSPVMGLLYQYLGTILNSLGLIIAAIVLSLFGIRPLIAFLQREPSSSPDAPQDLLPLSMGQNALADPFADIGEPLGKLDMTSNSDGSPAGTSSSGVDPQKETIREQLKDMISENEERAADTVKQWLNTSNPNLG